MKEKPVSKINNHDNALFKNLYMITKCYVFYFNIVRITIIHDEDHEFKTSIFNILYFLVWLEQSDGLVPLVSYI